MSLKNIVFLLTFTFSFLLFICSSSSLNFSAVYAFGDSISDTGNNNYIPTIFRSNFIPYGQDFPNGKPTGRFNNGFLIVDFIGDALGLKNVTPPYLNTASNTQELQTGVSFASFGSGLDPLTPPTFSALSFPTQIDLFEQALRTIREISGGVVANSIVQDALFLITIGTTDKILYYDVRLRRITFTVSEYHDFLLQHLELNVQRLYNIGARKFLISNLPAVGCLPLQITAAGRLNRRCVEQQNNDSVDYNSKFQLLLTRLESQLLPDSKIVPYDFYYLPLEVAANPSKYGFEETLKGYCRTGTFEVGPSCIGPQVEKDASKYLFFDALNPTQELYKILADAGIQEIRSQFSV